MNQRLNGFLSDFERHWRIARQSGKGELELEEPVLLLSLSGAGDEVTMASYAAHGDEGKGHQGSSDVSVTNSTGDWLPMVNIESAGQNESNLLETESQTRQHASRAELEEAIDQMLLQSNIRSANSAPLNEVSVERPLIEGTVLAVSLNDFVLRENHAAFAEISCGPFVGSQWHVENRPILWANFDVEGGYQLVPGRPDRRRVQAAVHER